MAGDSLSVQCPPIRTSYSPTGIHEANETSISTLEIKGSEADCLLGRSYDHWERQDRSGGGISECKQPDGKLKLCDKLREVTSHRYSEDGVLGFIIDSVSMTFRLPQDKVKDIRQKCRCALQDPRLTIRELAHLIGTLVATRLAVTPAPLHYCSLQALKIRELLHHPSYESKVLLERQSQMDLEWWVNHLKDHNGSPIHLSPPEMIIESDASNTGWGAHWNNQKTGGQLSAWESRLHINAKELLAAFLSLQTFAKDKTGIHVRLRLDNLHQQDGWHSFQGVDGNYSSSMGMEHTQEHNISAEHLPGKLNTTADHESRLKGDSSEWMLDPAVFHQIMEALGPCQIDLFASRLSAQPPRYMSWRPDPGSIATDALSQPWVEIRGFAFPPFSLIGRCLSKVKREKVSELILVAPVWPTQPWFAVLLLMLYQKPIILPKYPSLLKNPLNNSHPLIHQLNLAVWPVSGIPSRVKEFQEQRQVSSYPHGGKQQRQHTPAIGEDGSDGVPHLDATLFVPL